MPEFIKLDDIVWNRIKYLRIGQSTSYKYEIVLNEPLASWDVYDYWERERIESMEVHLKQGDILFDVGTEQGWCNLIYAKLVGPRNMVLIEPTPEFWPNIKALWEKNFGVDNTPEGFYDGLFSDKTTDKRDDTLHVEWPSATSGELIDRNKYIYLHEDHEGINEIKLDDYVEQTGLIPDALTIDTEGSELLILKGAEKTLKKHKPKLWVSIHAELGLRDYDTDPQDTIDYLESLGYKGEWLATDHEAHWYFS